MTAKLLPIAEGPISGQFVVELRPVPPATANTDASTGCFFRRISTGKKRRRDNERHIGAFCSWKITALAGRFWPPPRRSGYQVNPVTNVTELSRQAGDATFRSGDSDWIARTHGLQLMENCGRNMWRGIGADRLWHGGRHPRAGGNGFHRALDQTVRIA